MKKIIALVLAIVMVMALVSCGTKTVVTDREQDRYVDPELVETGNITMDTLVAEQEYGGPGCPYYIVYVRDLFTTGALGTAESSGVLSYGTVGEHKDPAYTWTLKNGVCIIKGNPDSDEWVYGVNADNASPLWNNPYIETVIVENNVSRVGGWTFKNNVPNLKTVIFLGDAGWNNKGARTFGGELIPTFPTDHDINYVIVTDRYDKPGKRPATALGNDSISNTVHYDSTADFLTAATPVIQSATMSDEGIAVLKAQAPDLYNAVIAAGGFNSTGTTVDPTPVTDTTKMSSTPDFDVDAVVKKLTTSLDYLQHPVINVNLGQPKSAYGYKANANGDVFKITVDLNGKSDVAYVGTEAPDYKPGTAAYEDAVLTIVLFYYEIKDDGSAIVHLDDNVRYTGNTATAPTETPADKPDYKVSDWAKADLAAAEELGIFEAHSYPLRDVDGSIVGYLRSVDDATKPATRGEFCGYIAGLFKALGKEDMLTDAFSYKRLIESPEYKAVMDKYYVEGQQYSYTPGGEGDPWPDDPFVDISHSIASNYYFEEVYQLHYLGIINGYGDKRFDYYGTLTREQAATLLIRAADVLGIDAPDVDIPFKDNISTWALNGVRRAYGAKLMSGYDANTFGAQDPYTIEQAIVTTYRLYQLANK